MIRRLVKKLGIRKSALAITAVSIVISVALYLMLSEIIGDFSSKGLLRSIFIPGSIAPILSYLLLRVYMQLDVAEEKIRKNEELLRKEKAFIENALDNLVDAFAVLDPQGRFLRWNKAVTEVTGHTNDEMRKLQPADFFSQETLPCISGAIEKVLREGHTKTEAVVVTTQGKRIPYEFTGGLLREANGHPLSICVSGRDISERKQVEDALRKSEERHRSVFENTGTATVIIDENMTISMANTEFERLSGYTKEQIEGKMRWTEFVVGDDLERMSEYHRNRRQGGGVPPAEYEFRFIDRKRRVKTVFNKVSMIPGTKLSTASLLDISERKRIEEEKRRLEGRLRQAQKMEAIGTLAGGIAHDFNNILAAIIGHTEMARLKVPDESKAKASLEKVLKASERAKDLVKQILSFSRQTEQEMSPIQLEPIVKEALRLLRASLPATIEMLHDHEKELGFVRADSTQIYQVLMNLCTNAAHAMGENGGKLEISLAKADIDADFAANHPDMKPGLYVRMSVSDTGRGIDPETMERIFEPYFTTKEMGKGTGLGLAVVHGIVKAHGGAITVESEPAKGTAVSVYLPRIANRASVEKAGPVEFLPVGHEHILFIDDEPTLVDMAKEMLDYLGYKVTTSSNSLDALKLFREQPDRFDLVITDLSMPNMTGDRLSKEIVRTRPDIPVILCTGYSETLTEEKTRLMGIQEYAMKPLVLNDMAVIIRKALDKTRPR